MGWGIFQYDRISKTSRVYGLRYRGGFLMHFNTAIISNNPHLDLDSLYLNSFASTQFP